MTVAIVITAIGSEKATVLIRRKLNNKNSHIDTNNAARFDTVSHIYFMITMSSASYESPS
jgi:hypothetical protein